MSINLHIERLVLEGLPISARDGAFLQRAMKRAMMHLLETRGLPGVSTEALPYLASSAINLTSDSRPEELGDRIARAVHNAVAPQAQTSAGKGSL